MKFKEEADKFYSNLEKSEDGLFYKKRRVYPVLNEDGSINYFNLITGGSYKKLIFTIIFIGIVIGFIFEYHSNLEYCTELINYYNNVNNISIDWNEFNKNIPNITNFSIEVQK